MKKEIIYAADYALVVSDEEIKEGDLVFVDCSEVEVQDIRKVKDYYNEQFLFENGGQIHIDYCKKVIAHRPLKDAPILEGVPLLPEFSKEDDVKKLALKTYPFSNSERNAFITGYNKAKETYKYTEEDLRKAMRMYKGEFTKGIVYSQDSIIQSLNQSEPKLPVAIECEMKKDYLYNDDGDKYGFPVHPTNEVKTTTNSQGQIEIVGEYIYE
jgi:alpha-amylase/alpha-mannosidase (GH57 family)